MFSAVAVHDQVRVTAFHVIQPFSTSLKICHVDIGLQVNDKLPPKFFMHFLVQQDDLMFGDAPRSIFESRWKSFEIKTRFQKMQNQNKIKT